MSKQLDIRDPRFRVKEGYGDLATTERDETLVDKKNLPAVERFKITAGANAVAAALYHNHAEYDPAALEGINTVGELQAHWKDVGQMRNELNASSTPGMEGWTQVADNMIGHRTQSGRCRVTLSKEALDIGLYTRGETEEGAQVARVKLGEDLSHMRVELRPDLVAERPDRVSLLWQMDKEMDGVITRGLSRMVVEGGQDGEAAEAAGIMLELRRQYLLDVERSERENKVAR